MDRCDLVDKTGNRCQDDFREEALSSIIEEKSSVGFDNNWVLSLWIGHSRMQIFCSMK